jgi:hypothetical protein
MSTATAGLLKVAATAAIVAAAIGVMYAAWYNFSAEGNLKSLEAWEKNAYQVRDTIKAEVTAN